MNVERMDLRQKCLAGYYLHNNPEVTQSFLFASFIFLYDCLTASDKSLEFSIEYSDDWNYRFYALSYDRIFSKAHMSKSNLKLFHEKWIEYGDEINEKQAVLADFLIKSMRPSYKREYNSLREFIKRLDIVSKTESISPRMLSNRDFSEEDAERFNEIKRFYTPELIESEYFLDISECSFIVNKKDADKITDDVRKQLQSIAERTERLGRAGNWDDSELLIYVDFDENDKLIIDQIPIDQYMDD